MVVARGLDIDRRLHVAEVQRHPVQLQHTPGQRVVLVEVAQVEQVQRLGHPRLVAVPEQQVEGLGLLAHQVVVHEERPDQVVAAQRIEGVGHRLAGQEAARLVHGLLDVPQPGVVDEQLQVARLLEVLLGGEEGGRADPLVTLCRHMGQGAGEQGAADAVADGVHAIGAALLHHLGGGVVDALLEVALEGLRRERLVRVDPAGHEDAEALAGQPAHQAVIGSQVGDVELVDPRREQQQRDLVHLLGGRGELQQLQDVVLVDDLARRCGDILADLELLHVGLADGQLAAAAGQVLGEVLHPAHQALAAGGHGFAEGGGVRHQEVGR